MNPANFYHDPTVLDGKSHVALISDIQQILEMVARYVTDEKLRASWYLWRDAFKLMSGRFKSAELFARLVNAGGDLVCTRDTMPLGYALDAGSGRAQT